MADFNMMDLGGDSNDEVLSIATSQSMDSDMEEEDNLDDLETEMSRESFLDGFVPHFIAPPNQPRKLLHENTIDREGLKALGDMGMLDDEFSSDLDSEDVTQINIIDFVSLLI